MIWLKTLWHKSWLESRSRFLGAAVVMGLVIGWDILDSKHGMSRFDMVPPITFTQYVAYLFRGHLQWLWVASVLLLGMGGLVREDARGTAQFTLTLPFRRRQWMQVRAALGLMQAAFLALIPFWWFRWRRILLGSPTRPGKRSSFPGCSLRQVSSFSSAASFGRPSWAANLRRLPSRAFPPSSLSRPRITCTGGFPRSSFRIST